MLTPGGDDSGFYSLFLVSQNVSLSSLFQVPVKYSQKILVEVYGGDIKKQLQAII
jgi:hypothetical protein